MESPGGPSHRSFADRWTMGEEDRDGNKRTALSLSARNRDGSTAPSESREIRSAAAHAGAFVTLRVAPEKAWREMEEARRNGRGEHDGDWTGDGEHALSSVTSAQQRQLTCNFFLPHCRCQRT